MASSRCAPTLAALLELLLSENRADRLKDEQSRIRDYIKEIERLERTQRSVQGRNEGGVEEEQLAKEQEQVADRTETLSDRIQETEASTKPSSPSESDSRQGDSENRDSEDSSPLDDEENDGDNQSKTPSRRKRKARAAKDSRKTAVSQAKMNPRRANRCRVRKVRASKGRATRRQPGQSGQGQSQKGGQQPQDESFPGQKRIQEAEQQMRNAQEKLDQAKRDEALENQKQAARKLAEAKAELEEILRQMREEEIERTLAQLEARVRKMLEMELQLNESTIRLARRQADDPNRVFDIEAGKLSFQQRRIVVEADKCLAVLREEGSSVAFPASMEQVREDMEEVVNRLAEVKLGAMTQGLEEDIIEALEEMIEALQQAQEDQEQRQQNPQSQPPSEPGDQPLVSQIAELKMIKALQLRINRRTDRYSKMLDDADDVVGQATDEELTDALCGIKSPRIRFAPDHAGHQPREEQVSMNELSKRTSVLGAACSAWSASYCKSAPQWLTTI